MEQSEVPTAERLIDHAWMVDCALLLEEPDQAAIAAERLLDELVVQDRDLARTRWYLPPHVAEDLATQALKLQDSVRVFCDDLRRCAGRPRPGLRSQVEAFILAVAVAVGDWGPPYVD